jgi:hypothetical protein
MAGKQGQVPREMGVGSRGEAVGSGQSAVGSRQSAVKGLDSCFWSGFGEARARLVPGVTRRRRPSWARNRRLRVAGTGFEGWGDLETTGPSRIRCETVIRMTSRRAKWEAYAGLWEPHCGSSQAAVLICAPDVLSRLLLFLFCVLCRDADYLIHTRAHNVLVLFRIKPVISTSFVSILKQN